MHRIRSLLRTVALAATALAFTPPAAAWTIIDLGTLGGSSTEAWGVNNAGVVVGSSMPASGSARAFLWHPNSGSMTDLGTLGGAGSYARQIDDLGHVVGGSRVFGAVPDSPTLWRAVLSTPLGGSLGSLGTFQGQATVATSLPPGGARRVVGHAIKSDGSAGAGFVSGPNGGPLAALPLPPGATACQPTDINDKLRVVGICGCPQACRGYMHHVYDGSPIAINPGPFYLPNSISNPPLAKAFAVSNVYGVIVGSRRLPSGEFVPARWNNPYQDPITLPMLGALRGEARAINGSGQVVGMLEFAPVQGNTQRAVLWPARGQPLVLETLAAVQAAGWYNLYAAYGINDAGWIVGIGARSSPGAGTKRAFLLMP